jgi:hypothetical protein
VAVKKSQRRVRRSRARSPKRTTTRRGARPQSAPLHTSAIEIQEIESLRAELDRLSRAAPPRWNADPDDVRRSVGKLVLTLVEFVRQILERQAIRRMEDRTLSADQTEAIGQALMQLERTILDLADQFGLDPADLNLDLGPLGKLV